MLLVLPLMGMARGPESASSVGTPAKISAQDRVDINHASLDELIAVPGMTHSWAERIIRFRPYHAKNDLVKRGVVSGEVYDRIKDAIVAHRDKQ